MPTTSFEASFDDCWSSVYTSASRVNRFLIQALTVASAVNAVVLGINMLSLNYGAGGFIGNPGVYPDKAAQPILGMASDNSKPAVLAGPYSFIGFPWTSERTATWPGQFLGVTFAMVGAVPLLALFYPKRAGLQTVACWSSIYLASEWSVLAYFSVGLSSYAAPGSSMFCSAAYIANDLFFSLWQVLSDRTFYSQYCNACLDSLYSSAVNATTCPGSCQAGTGWCKPDLTNPSGCLGSPGCSGLPILQLVVYLAVALATVDALAIKLIGGLAWAWNQLRACGF